VSAVVVGGAVWLVIGAAVCGWLIFTQVAGPQQVPGVTAVVGWFLSSWLGRVLVLAAWGGAGWHLFCQRP
jgi:hypothetical protein